MPKKVFWPAALAIMGFILLSSNLGIMPHAFWNLWPIILIVVGLGGLITADRDGWICNPSSSKKPTSLKKKTIKKTAETKIGPKGKKTKR
ncbi:MAG TPA: DUF5668 domain-containing protein [Candidatus Woesebacteria bacterium]|nr:DUF5668 domain-containing protein [Candidatus Woesebacteria bacterium]